MGGNDESKGTVKQLREALLGIEDVIGFRGHSWVKCSHEKPCGYCRVRAILAMAKKLEQSEKPKTEMIYLAIPYTHDDPLVRERRFQVANIMAADIKASNRYVFSPITHGHPLAQTGKLPTGWEYWKEYDRLMLSICTELWVVKMEGWKESVGVQGEIEIAKEMGIPIKYVEAIVEDLK